MKDVKEKVLPEITDEWAGEASEFDTVDELRADLRKRIGMVKKVAGPDRAAQTARSRRSVDLVAEDPPEALVEAEVERRLQRPPAPARSAGRRPSAQYLEATGQSGEQLIADDA